MEEIINRLSAKLNRPVSNNFIELLRSNANTKTTEEFATFCEVLGIPDPQFVKDVYVELNTDATNTNNGSRKPLEKKKKKLISFDDDLEELLTTNKKPLLKFKKLKREDTLRFKQETREQETREQETREQETKEHQKIEHQKTDEKSRLDDKSIKVPSFSTSVSDSISDITQESIEVDKDSLHTAQLDSLGLDLENDREWYVDEYEEPLEESNPRPKPKIKPRVTKSGTGGGFTQHGEYFDLDHDTSTTDVSKLPIRSHFFIPPFLDEFKEYLNVTINDGNHTFLKGVTKTVDPIKNPDSRLAIMAKQGSLVVQERRSKKEKMKQARDRSNIAGTKLGNILGVIDNGDDGDDGDNNDKQNDSNEHNPEQESISLQRKSLPVYSVRSQLLGAINDNQITIIVGETGSGKTTQLTQYLYEEGYCKQNSIIGCTQPRRVAAMSVAKRVSEEMNCQLGKKVGYAIRFEDRTSKDTMIKYMTDGILLRELIADPNLDKYSCVIMDEAHERSLDTDILLGLLKNLVMKRKDLKLIITSATMNADKFTTFFGNAPQFQIPGRTYPVDILYNRSATDYVESLVKQVITIHLDTLNENKESDGDILVFMTGQEDIEVTCELIQEKLDLLKGIPPLDVYPIYSSLPADLQKKIFNKSNKLRRKVVVATNIAETSLTVDGIKYVIDCGLVKLKVYNPKLGMDALQVIPISQANANQRSGRAGRTGPGKAFRLYSEKEVNEDMNMMPIPEIQRTNLSNVMLLLRSLRVKDVNKFPFLDPPPNDIVSYSLYDLWSMGAVDNRGDLTSLGHQMIHFPMEPSLSKLIILSTKPRFHCSQEILTIVSMLSVPNIFVRPKERAQEADMAREKFAVSDSDHLTLLSVYNHWEVQAKRLSMSQLAGWCGKNFVNNRSLLRARDIKTQLTMIMVKKNYPMMKSNREEDIKRCLCASFFNQLARLSKLNLGANQLEYIHLRHGFIKMYLHPNSVLNNSRTLPADYVIYHQLILTKKEYMSCVSSVDPLWLLEFGYVFYHINKHDRAKYLDGVELGFELIDPKMFEEGLEQDRVKQEIKEQTTSNKVEKTFKRNKFKKRGI